MYLPGLAVGADVAMLNGRSGRDPIDGLEKPLPRRHFAAAAYLHRDAHAADRQHLVIRWA